MDGNFQETENQNKLIYGTELFEAATELCVAATFDEPLAILKDVAPQIVEVGRHQNGA